MIGCLLTTDGHVIDVGTSKNYPRVTINKREYTQRYQARREQFLGSEIWEYDATIQQKINADVADVTGDLSPEHRKTRKALTGHCWAVFCGDPALHTLCPGHYEQRCFA